LVGQAHTLQSLTWPNLFPPPDAGTIEQSDRENMGGGECSDFHHSKLRSKTRFPK